MFILIRQLSVMWGPTFLTLAISNFQAGIEAIFSDHFKEFFLVQIICLF